MATGLSVYPLRNGARGDTVHRREIMEVQRTVGVAAATALRFVASALASAFAQSAETRKSCSSTMDLATLGCEVTSSDSGIFSQRIGETDPGLDSDKVPCARGGEYLRRRADGCPRPTARQRLGPPSRMASPGTRQVQTRAHDASTGSIAERSTAMLRSRRRERCTPVTSTSCRTATSLYRVAVYADTPAPWIRRCECVRRRARSSYGDERSAGGCIRTAADSTVAFKRKAGMRRPSASIAQVLGTPDHSDSHHIQNSSHRRLKKPPSLDRVDRDQRTLRDDLAVEHHLHRADLLALGDRRDQRLGHVHHRLELVVLAARHGHQQRLGDAQLHFVGGALPDLLLGDRLARRRRACASRRSGSPS